MGEMADTHSESDLRIKIVSLINAQHPRLGCRTEVTVGSGRADIVAGGVVVEVKKRGQIKAAENLEQLGGYVSALEADRRADLGDDGSVEWKGVLTDGNLWYFCAGLEAGRLREAEPVDASKRGSRDSICGQLFGFINPDVLAFPPVHDAGWVNGLVEPFMDLAAKALNSKANSVGLETKWQLWADLLAGSHVVPPSDDEASLELFARHTMLVLLARLVRCEVVRSKVDVTEGFPVWVDDCGGGGLVSNLQEEVRKYNWNAGRDILKDLYHTAIPAPIRHDFGEYYTPDWLAEAVVEEVCDTAWTTDVFRRISSGEDITTPQVVDPSCGSGTFIYSAVKRLAAGAEEICATDQKLAAVFADPVNQARILNRLVGGIDLHPIAVELAQTTKLLALGTDPGEPLNIWLGDSLQWDIASPAQQSLIAQTFDISTSVGAISLPVKFVEADNYHQKLGILFDAVESNSSRDSDAADFLASGGDEADGGESASSVILQAIADLRALLEAGRNGVWQWYLDNIAQPYRLSRNQPARLVGNPPWVVYSSMAAGRQDEFKTKAMNRRHLGRREIRSEE